MVTEFWKESYPAMGDRTENFRRAEEVGFEVVTHRVLSDEGCSSYYSSLLDALECDDGRMIDPNFRNAIAREIDARQRSEGSFGYTFYVFWSL